MKIINIEITYFNPHANAFKNEIQALANVTYKDHFWSKQKTRVAFRTVMGYARWKDTGEYVSGFDVDNKIGAHEALASLS